MMRSSARNGGAFVFLHADVDVGVALVNAHHNVLLVLNILPEHRSHGLGSAVLKFLQCNFARVVESAIPFFERNGYVSIGRLKQGKKLKTQIMVKDSLRRLAGRVAGVFTAS